jgi:hypothetical protein
MAGEGKKTDERRIFDLVYAERSPNEVAPHENPDFLVRLAPALPYFGVEVTSYYVSESSARLDRIEGYTSELLDGGRFRHKNDIEQLDVTQADIIKADGSIHAKDVRMVMQELPPLGTCAREIAERIVAKGKRIVATRAEMSHANLIIEDRSSVLRTMKNEDFYKNYFVSELIAAIRRSPFREIYLVTALGGGGVYVPLKMLHLLAEAYMFDGALAKYEGMEIGIEMGPTWALNLGPPS